MAKIIFNITPENEQKLREKNRKRGDISKIINQALEQYFKEVKQWQKQQQNKKQQQNPINQFALRRVHPNMGHGGDGHKVPRRESLTKLKATLSYAVKC